MTEAAYHNFPPPPKEKVKKTIEGWVNVYQEGPGRILYLSEADANTCEKTNIGRIACVRVSGEYFCDE